MKTSFDKVIVDKDKEIACLRNHSQTLLRKVKKNSARTLFPKFKKH